MSTEHVDLARLALLRAENIEQHREARERDAASSHGRAFVNNKKLMHIRTALTALAQIETEAEPCVECMAGANVGGE